MTLVTSLAMQEVLEDGQSRVDGVPRDQADGLRTAIRRELRRHKLRGRTYMREETVFVISDDAYEALPQERTDEIQQQLVRALDWLSDEPHPPTRSGINWNTWRISP